MTLIKCESFWGSDSLFESAPSIEKHEWINYIPYNGGQNWGIFDNSGSIIGSTADYRTAEKLPKSQNVMATINADHVTEVSDHHSMIYCGRFNPHFGHFLIDFLSRFWLLAQQGGSEIPILCHDVVGAEQWFDLPYVADIMGRLELKPSSFVTYSHPIRVRNLIIPHTSFREQAYAHQAFSALCTKIGRPILAAMQQDTARRIYLSKRQLLIGVGQISEEHILEEKFLSAGYEIIHPEKLPFREQINLFNGENVIVSTIGSALHSSIFALPTNRIITLSTINMPNSNYSLIDKLRGKKSEYYFAEGTERTDAKPGFLSTYHVPGIKRVADELIDIAASRAP